MKVVGTAVQRTVKINTNKMAITIPPVGSDNIYNFYVENAAYQTSIKILSINIFFIRLYESTCISNDG